MTDDEFLVLDELYFVQSYAQLEKEVEVSPEELLTILRGLFEKDWIKVMNTIDDEMTVDQINWEIAGKTYFFLASKNGLLAHNS